MKKMMVLALLGLSAMMTANASTYVQGDVMSSNLSMRATGFDKDNDTEIGARVAVGKDMGSVRYVADYTHFGRAEHKKGLEVSSDSIGASAIYDFQTTSNLTPYAGVRVGVNYVKTRAKGAVKYDKTDEYKMAAGVSVGAQYHINPKIAVDGGVEYNYLGKGVADDQYGAKVGVRYNF